MSKAVWIIRDEHQRYGAVLNLVRNLITRADAGPATIDVDLLDLAFDYIVDFIDTYHHPKEDDYLFRLVRRRSSEADAIIAELEGEHGDGERKISALRLLLDRLRQDRTDKHFIAFKAAALDYIDFEAQHAMKENDRLLPIAERVLTPADWSEIEAAFADNDDPAFGDRPRAKFAAMMAQIVRRAPAPYGYRT